MIIWSGMGWIVAAIGFGCFLAMELATRAIFQDNHYYQSHGWPKLVAFWIAASIVWPVGRSMNGGDDRELIDPKTGERVVLRRGQHRLFFVPVEYWGAIW